MYNGKPIIGIVGGIGAGKSFVANLFGELGCEIIRSDDVAKAAYDDVDVKKTIHSWWGDAVFAQDGKMDRRAIAQRIFGNEDEKKRLEGLIHPIVHQKRHQQMKNSDTGVKAFIWDTPLLIETGMDKECDVVVFVDAPLEIRQARVASTRGWDSGEILRRENLQQPLDKKQKISQYTIVNAADADSVRSQVRQVFSRIIHP